MPGNIETACERVPAAAATTIPKRRTTTKSSETHMPKKEKTYEFWCPKCKQKLPPVTKAQVENRFDETLTCEGCGHRFTRTEAALDALDRLHALSKL